MISCIIIDDEARARVLLQAIIDQYCPNLVVIEQCAELISGIKAIKKLKPQLVFLDIEMPGHSGLDILDFFEPQEVNFGIIFTTAYNEYALQAFKFSAIDYLLKPIQHALLVDAVARFELKNELMQAQQLSVLKQNLVPSETLDDKRIIVAVGQTYKMINPKDIIMIKGEGAYSEIYLDQQPKIVASKNLKHFEEILDKIPNFFRSHKSYIININAVIEYVKSDGGFLILKGNQHAGISADKVNAFLIKLS